MCISVQSDFRSAKPGNHVLSRILTSCLWIGQALCSDTLSIVTFAIKNIGLDLSDHARLFFNHWDLILKKTNKSQSKQYFNSNRLTWLDQKRRCQNLCLFYLKKKIRHLKLYVVFKCLNYLLNPLFQGLHCNILWFRCDCDQLIPN